MSANSDEINELRQQLEGLELRLKDLGNKQDAADSVAALRKKQELEHSLLEEAVSKSTAVGEYLIQIKAFREEYIKYVTEVNQSSQISRPDDFIETLKYYYEDLLADKEIDRDSKEKLLLAISILQYAVQELYIDPNIMSSPSSPEQSSNLQLEEPDDEDKAISEYSSKINTFINCLSDEDNSIETFIETFDEWYPQLTALSEKLIDDDRICAKLKGVLLSEIHGAQRTIDEMKKMYLDAGLSQSPPTQWRYSPQSGRYSPGFHQLPPVTSTVVPASEQKNQFRSFSPQQK